METKIKVTNKWDGDLAVIYAIKNNEPDADFKQLLLFYSRDKDPKFSYGEETTLDEVKKTFFYKTRTWESWDDIPTDMAQSLTW